MTTLLSSVSLDPVAWVIRYHPEGGYGTPYTFACAMTRYNDEATLFAASGKFTSEVGRKIEQELIRAGIKTVRWQRRNRQVTKEVSVVLGADPAAFDVLSGVQIQGENDERQ